MSMEWIKCSERLPSQYVTVVLLVGKRLLPAIGCFDGYDRCWEIEKFGNLDFDGVYYWLPLPPRTRDLFLITEESTND